MTRDFRLELLMDAGNGAQKAGDILIKAFAKSGAFVFIEPIIPAEISPPKRTPYSLSGAVIRLATEEIANIGSYSDFIVVEHEILLNRRLDDQEFAKGSTILLDCGNQARAKDAYEAAINRATQAGSTVVSFLISETAEALMKELRGNGRNMYYLGLLTRVFRLDKAIVLNLIKETFKRLSDDKLEKNLAIFEEGFQGADVLYPKGVEIETEASTGGDKILMDGNTAMAMGVIDAGIKLYAGYPITPASSIMHVLAKIFQSYGGIFHQAEDEISAIGTVIGSYFSGVPAITATSGPGLSLKQEFLGLSVSSEIPCILIDVQRGGPSTGLPTRTEQTDLFAAAFGSHGDGPKVVLSVANVEDCFYSLHVARYITEICRVPVIILSDYMTSVSYRVLDKFKLNELEDVRDIHPEILQRFRLSPLPEDIQMVKDNQSAPGVEDKMRRATGLNTNAEGFVEYSADTNQRSHDIRNEKLHHVRRALEQPEIIGEPEGELLIVGWGSTRGALEESIQTLGAEGVSALHFKMVYPLPLMLNDIFSRFKKVVTVEVAYGDDLKPTPFATLLRSETLCDVKGLIAQATGRPLKPVDIITKARQVLVGETV